MTIRTLAASAIAALLISAPATAASIQSARHGGRAEATYWRARSALAPRLPNAADWQKIQNAARLRGMALAPHRTAYFRAVAAHLGLRQLVSIDPLAPGRCAIAVRYLYNNLLDLADAFPGEDWRPLRQLVAKEPSIQACAPTTDRRALDPHPGG